MEDVIFFNGQRVKAVFDLDNQEPHIPLHLKLRVTKWSQLGQLVNETKEAMSSGAVGVHIHNELTLGDLLMLVNKDYFFRNKHRTKELHKMLRQLGYLNMTRHEMHEIMNLGQPPVVFTNTADENWGFFSTSKCTCNRCNTFP